MRRTTRPSHSRSTSKSKGNNHLKKWDIKVTGEKLLWWGLAHSSKNLSNFFFFKAKKTFLLDVHEKDLEVEINLLAQGWGFCFGFYNGPRSKIAIVINMRQLSNEFQTCRTSSQEYYVKAQKYIKKKVPTKFERKNKQKTRERTHLDTRKNKICSFFFLRQKKENFSEDGWITSAYIL